jgi:O-antigen/teichoic acid export membrane protein
MELAERIRRGLKATLVARTVHVTSTGVLMVVLARYLLAPDEYGLLFLAIATFGIVQLFANLGLAKSAARYLTEYRETDPGQVPYVVSSALKFRLIAAAAVGGFFLLAPEPLAALIGNDDLVPLFGLGALYIVCFSLTNFASILFQGFNRVDWSALLRATSSLTRFVLVIAFVTVVGGALGAMVGYVVSYALAAVFGLGVLYVRFYREYDRAERSDPGLSRRLLRYSGPLAATQGANVLDNRVDTVLIGYFMNPTAVGYYYLGKQIVDFLQTPASALGAATSPSYGEQKAADRLESAASLYQTTLEHTLLLYVPAGVGMLLVAEPAIRLVFGADYLGAVPVVQIFSAYLVLQAVTYVTGNGLDYLGRARARAVTKGVTSVGNFLLNVVLIPVYGIVGAAAATVFTHTIYVGLNLYVINQEFSLDVRRLAVKLSVICLITVGMSATVLFLLPNVTNLLTFASVVAVGAAVWVFLSVLSGQLDPERVVALFR